MAHHVTFAVDWMPAGIVGIPGLPAIWGPVGGTTGTPWSLWRWLGWRGILNEAVREATTRPMRRLFGDPVARRAAVIVAQNHDVARRFSNHGPLVVEPNVALDLDEMNATIERARGLLPESDRSRAVFVGRLIPLKGLRMAIAALTEPRAAGWELHVYGSGPERKPAGKLAIRSGVAERVVFHGQCERAEVLAAIAAADTLLLPPSMHDAGGWAVGEAVTLGVPTVCLDRGGPPILVGGQGHAVSPEGRATPARLAEALRR